MPNDLTQINYAHFRILSPNTSTAVIPFYLRVIKWFKVNFLPAKNYHKHLHTYQATNLCTKPQTYTQILQKRKLTNNVSFYIRHKNCMPLVLYTLVTGNTIGQKKSKFTAQKHTRVPMLALKYFIDITFIKFRLQSRKQTSCIFLLD